MQLHTDNKFSLPGLDINVCPIPVKTDVGQVDLVLRLSDGISEKIRFPNMPVLHTHFSPRKNEYILVFPPERSVYTHVSPPERSVYTHLSP